jgi:hypothetical protein
MSINNLYNEQQNDLQQELQKLYNQNKDVINYFTKIDSSIKEAILSSNKEEVKTMLESVKTQLNNLSQLKFSIFDLEDEIPEELSKKWNKRVKYITQQMSINEVDRFIKVIEEFKNIKHTKKDNLNKLIKALRVSLLYLPIYTYHERVYDYDYDENINRKINFEKEAKTRYEQIILPKNISIESINGLYRIKVSLEVDSSKVNWYDAPKDVKFKKLIDIKKYSINECNKDRINIEFNLAFVSTKIFKIWSYTDNAFFKANYENFENKKKCEDFEIGIEITNLKINSYTPNWYSYENYNNISDDTDKHTSFHISRIPSNIGVRSPKKKNLLKIINLLN